MLVVVVSGFQLGPVPNILFPDQMWLWGCILFRPRLPAGGRLGIARASSEAPKMISGSLFRRPVMEDMSSLGVF